MDPEEKITGELDRFGRMVIRIEAAAEKNLSRMKAAAEKNEGTIGELVGPKGPIQANAKAIASLVAKQTVQWWLIALLFAANIVKAFL